MAQKLLLGQLSDIEIRRLRVFRVVAEAGGISAAELELNIGRSTISTHIKDLETRLGVTLCRRGRGGFALTDEGEHIYQATLRLLGSLDEFRAEVNDLHQSMTGHISLALFDKTASNPEAHIGKAFQLFDVIPAHRTSSSLDYVPLFSEQMYLYCGQEHPLYGLEVSATSKKDILSYKYAGLGYHSPNMEIGRSLGMKRDVTVYDQEAIVHLLLSGRYLGYLPDHYARPFVEQGLIRAIGTDIFQYRCEFQAITRTSPKPSRAVQVFLDCLVKAHR